MILARFRDYMARHSLSNIPGHRKKLAQIIGTNSTYIYRYLINEFVGNLKEFQEKLTGFLDGEVARIVSNRTIIKDDFIVKPVWAFLRHCKAHGFIGVGYGDAGRGKTCATQLYTEIDKTAIYVHVNAWKGHHGGLVTSIAKALKINAGRRSVDEAVVQRLNASSRLLILDNAHKLKESARSWLADFWEETRIPIALIGNPEILEQFTKCDQHGSRIGLRRDITVELEDTALASATHLIQLHYPEGIGNKAILKEAAQGLLEFGSCRTVSMRLKLAHEMMEGGKIKNGAEESFILAKEHLITPDDVKLAKK